MPPSHSRAAVAATLLFTSAFLAARESRHSAPSTFVEPQQLAAASSSIESQQLAAAQQLAVANSSNSTSTNLNSTSTSPPHEKVRKAIEVVRLLGRIKTELSDFHVECAVKFAYCGRSSCSRTSPALENGLVAACACQSVEASHKQYATIDGGDSTMMQLFAQSDEFVGIMEDYLDGNATHDLTAKMLCESVRDNDYFRLGTYDRISLPTSTDTWDDTHPETAVVSNISCSNEMAIADCSGAPCYADRSAAGALNLTCLCPMFPYSDTFTHSLHAIAPDIGHMGGCGAYNFDGGDCAIQTSGNLQGYAEREWTVAAVVAASVALTSEKAESFHTQDAKCRAWFAA